MSGALRFVEAEPFHITYHDVDNAPLEVPMVSRSGAMRAPTQEKRNTPVRLGLQRRMDLQILVLTLPAVLRRKGAF